MLTRKPRGRVTTHLLDAAAAGLTAVVVGMVFAFLVINWVTGCGQVLRSTDGTEITRGVCVTPADLWRE